LIDPFFNVLSSSDSCCPDLQLQLEAAPLECDVLTHLKSIANRLLKLYDQSDPDLKRAVDFLRGQISQRPTDVSPSPTTNMVPDERKRKREHSMEQPGSQQRKWQQQQQHPMQQPPSSREPQGPQAPAQSLRPAEPRTAIERFFLHCWFPSAQAKDNLTAWLQHQATQSPPTPTDAQYLQLGKDLIELVCTPGFLCSLSFSFSAFVSLCSFDWMCFCWLL
jgi:hypothetical protein